MRFAAQMRAMSGFYTDKFNLERHGGAHADITLANVEKTVYRLGGFYQMIGNKAAPDMGMFCDGELIAKFVKFLGARNTVNHVNHSYIEETVRNVRKMVKVRFTSPLQVVCTCVYFDHRACF